MRRKSTRSRGRWWTLPWLRFAKLERREPTWLFVGLGACPTDVIGGWIVGFMWASVCWLAAQRFEERTGIEAEKSKSA